MKAYIIECGNQFILYVEGTKQYHLLTTELFSLFTAEQPDFSSLTSDLEFPSTDPQLLNFFCNPEENTGAFIAERSADTPRPHILHRYRFNTLRTLLQ